MTLQNPTAPATYEGTCRPLAELRHAPSLGPTLRNPGLATNATGPSTACPPRAPAAAETCMALTWQRDAVAKRSLIRLRKQKLLRQVFERLQDGLLCTFLEADGLEADERRVVGDQAVDASLNLFHLEGLLERLAQHP
jgi:hypothetical protein